ncbi:MAG: hypothetical protein ACLR5S_02265 [Ruminococcus sp.]
MRSLVSRRAARHCAPSSTRWHSKPSILSLHYYYIVASRRTAAGQTTAVFAAVPVT